jgi:hypothetical protein
MLPASLAISPLAALPPFFQFGALDAMRKLHGRHHGNPDLDFSVAPFEVFQDLSHCAALTLGGDDHTGIED